ncbi:NADPH-dependent FMN reductase [Lacimicrobium alkaliphilum]|uniref:NADPH-dependent FMN reductase n=1 Tax=Lacimicrobium alkaliphilum TaxID=1526571 RepID=A0A0U3AVF8_9ALTE|nr:NAD(P)H-dependent oxidoreductase [Lacimicrobium alkaliphilum]ALS98079.1 NADPH-dependent FMN reductase [Lacimicrobium alkaliphilum]
MKVFALGASSSKKSINKALASYAASQIRDAEVDVLDLNDYQMPIFSLDIEEEIGQHPLAKRFLDKIAAADAIIISYAEHNGSYTAAYKNVFDWASRINLKVFQGKPALWLATSPGPGGAQNVLSSAVNSAPHFNADLVGSLSVPAFYDNFNTSTNTLVNPDIQSKLDKLLQLLQEKSGVRTSAEETPL